MAKPSQAKGFDTQELGAGTLFFVQQGSNQQLSAMMLASQVHFDINGLIATATLTQSFINQTGANMNGTYAFPLPNNAAVNYLKIEIGERIIEGKIMDRQQAKKVFQQAKSQGKKASLVEQQRPNIFTNSIANIAANEQITVTLKYTQTVNYQDGHFSLRFPMTITERYNPQPLNRSQHTLESATSHYPLSLPETLTGKMRISAQLNAGIALDKLISPSHPLPVKVLNSAATSDDEKTRLAHSHRIALKQVDMDRDFILTWYPKPSATPQLSVFNERINNEQYTLLMLMPPTVELPHAIARDVTFIIDTSGSMQGASIEQAKQSLLFGLATLSPQDSFNIIAFESSATALFPQTKMASSQAISQAKSFVANLSADGGTEMVAPLSQALAMPMSNDQKPETMRQIIFITDGAVSNEQALFQLIAETQKLPRIFTVGIGAAPNGYFMRKAAQFGRGSYSYISDVNQVSDKMSALIAKISQPVLRDLSLQFHPLHLGNIEQFPKKLPDIYANEPLLLSFKSSQQPSSVELFGETPLSSWHQEIFLKNSSSNTGIATVWARAKIEDLLDSILTGANTDSFKQQVIQTSLNHQVMSPYTSFIAVEQAPLFTAKVDNQSLIAIKAPQTALGWQMKLLLGLLILFSGFLLHLKQQKFVR